MKTIFCFLALNPFNLKLESVAVFNLSIHSITLQVQLVIWKKYSRFFLPTMLYSLTA